MALGFVTAHVVHFFFAKLGAIALLGRGCRGKAFFGRSGTARAVCIFWPDVPHRILFSACVRLPKLTSPRGVRDRSEIDSAGP